MTPNNPKVSVVMSTYNDADCLPNSIESILKQDFKDFEFIIVNDGSTDPDVAEILDRYAINDSRIKVISKANEGLTKALMKGCALAKGKYIARQDADDRSLPGRFRAQYEELESRPDVVLVSCGTRFVTEFQEYLFDDVRQTSADEIRESMHADDVRDLRGLTSHGSAFFRRNAYLKVGGYRWQFYYAQDMDLWTRLVGLGDCLILPVVYYEASFSPNAISGSYNRQQLDLGRIIVELRKCRDRGLAEDKLLQDASRTRPPFPRSILRRRLGEARGNYFIGSALMKNGNQNSNRYFLNAIRLNPFLPSAWLKLILAKLTLRKT